jgi:NAD(P)-dependent dehydrogenase (short-subunit alcohol dehydrogenase family)
MLDFNDKTVVITGGTRGIGLAIAEQFHQSGANVFVGARSLPSQFKNKYPYLTYKKTDVRYYDEIEQLICYAKDQTGRFDVMVNNAGISVWKSIEKVEEDFYSLMMDTNLKGCFWGCKAAAKHFKDGGVIINIGSLAGKRGSKNNAVYCASKFGVVGLTQALAKELGEKKIRVNSVCPVYIKTDVLLSNLTEDHPEIKDRTPEKFLDLFGKNNAALGRIPQAEEVANTCAFLASPMASAITGQNLNVDCGVLPQ